MALPYEELATEFARVPLDVFGVYRTELTAGTVYAGHVHRPTTMCGVVMGLRGEADFIFNGKERYRLEPGAVLLGGLDMRLEIEVGGEGFEYGLVHYLPAAGASGDLRRLTDVTMLRVGSDPELVRLLEQLLAASSSPGSMSLLEKKALFYRLLNTLLLSERLVRNKESYEMIDDAIGFIRTHYMEPLTLDMLAGRYHMKAKYFSYLFQKYTGMGPIDYLIRYRMNRANELLVTGRFPVSAVARSVGYADAYYFSRLFKKHKGLPPGKVGLQRRRNSPS